MKPKKKKIDLTYVYATEFHFIMENLDIVDVLKTMRQEWRLIIKTSNIMKVGKLMFSDELKYNRKNKYILNIFINI